MEQLNENSDASISQVPFGNIDSAREKYND